MSSVCAHAFKLGIGGLGSRRRCEGSGFRLKIYISRGLLVSSVVPLG